jgi:hypothetical protein
MNSGDRMRNRAKGHQQNMEHEESWSEIARTWTRWGELSRKLASKNEGNVMTDDDLDTLSDAVLGDIERLRKRMQYYKIARHLTQWKVLQTCENVIRKDYERVSSAINELGCVSNIVKHL